MKQLSSLFFLLLFAFSASAQSTSHLEVGLIGGLNISNLHDESYMPYYDWHYSGLGGIQVKYAFSENLSLVTDIAYESKGTKGVNLKLVDPNGNSFGSNHEFKYTYKYITVPVLFRYTHTGFPFFVNAGPYLGYLLNYSEEYKNTKLDRTSDMKKTDFGFCLGAGIFYPISDKWNLSFEIRDNFGLTNIRVSDDTYKTAPFRPVIDLNPVHTNAINVLVGIHFKM